MDSGFSFLSPPHKLNTVIFDEFKKTRFSGNAIIGNMCKSIHCSYSKSV